MTTKIFNLPPPTSSPPKLHVSHASISQTYLDPSQPPTKRLPYRQIHDVPFIRSVQVCMPSHLHDALYPQSATTFTGLGGFQGKYTKVIVNLKGILDNETLRKGNYMMLSSSADGPVRMALNQGKLTFLMPHQAYQRCGLTFKTEKLQSGGRKHEKHSMLYRTDVDLRQPNMARSKPGFDRLMYAAKNVEGFKEAKTWLFVDLGDLSSAAMRGQKRKRGGGETGGWTETETSSEITNNPSAATATTSSTMSNTQHPQQQQEHILAQHHPTLITDTGTTSTFPDVLIPPAITNLPHVFNHLSSNTRAKFGSLPDVLQEDIYDITEYLSLLLLQSPQVTTQHYSKTDPYISQYRLPDIALALPSNVQQEPKSNGLAGSNEGDVLTGEGVKVEDVRIVRYEGLISSDWMTQVFVDLVRRSRAADKELANDDGAWVVVSVKAHKMESVGAKDGYMLVLSGAGTTEPLDVGETGEGDEVEVEDGTTVERRKKTGDKGKAKVRARGFQSVTCFEFVDSIT
ncbi:hypothetical protein H2198_007387 [Neophaeococcomyces mojaviensis]|uniref:Uncharacterized protein n=1 Tax=Neophaeococcomyces mojaviensis TaxID=3383035 RepID=A0ACC3A0C6_9EURO|nr:hypothetical protein H2198_007387 [Knufia sp. JES_112]